MSIKGIDTQIMITRLPDNLREASTLQKRPEVAQEYLAAQAKVSDALEQNKVTATLESEMEQIRTDVEEDGASGGYEGSGGSGAEDRSEADQDFLVPPDDHLIDIKV